MSDKPVIGFVGVGLMGWGMAKNAVEKGYPIRVVAHRKREAVEDLIGRGAVEVASAAEMAREVDAVVLCVTGAPEVEATVAAMAPSGGPGLTFIDASTSEPGVSARLAAELAAKGMTFLDAPNSRTPEHAWNGDLTTYVGGDPAAVARWRPLIETWASVVIETRGPAGSAHAIKLANNLISIGYAALWSEAYATVRRIGGDPAILHEVVSNSGMNCGNFQNFSAYVLEGDAARHRFSLSNMAKDLGYYRRMADAHEASTLVSDGAFQLLRIASALGHGERYMPELLDVVVALNAERAA